MPYDTTVTGPPPLVVLDDDPTGTQAVHDVPVLLRWPVEAVAEAVASGGRATHLMTNARAFPPAEAEALTRDAARAARAAAPGARLVLRGDSTLRGHVLEEYRAVAEVLGGDRPPVLLLVPALPAAGRVTRDGVHLLERDGRAVPLHDTEYARDGEFAYRSSRLLAWADERSGGWLAAGRGTEVRLEELRAEGPSAVAAALAAAARQDGPAACAPDAEDVADLERIAAGLRQAEAAGVPVLVRCAPAFAGVLAGNLAEAPVPPPPATGGVLLLCGSWVPGTTRQLRHLAEHRGLGPLELDPTVLAGDEPPARAAVLAAAGAARAALDRDGVAVVATARERPEGTRTLAAGLRIARRLAGVVAALDPAPGVVVAKGGITSAVTLQVGLGCDRAWVAGPLLPGVALWRARRRGREVGYVVVPGNVGDDALLTDLVDLLRAGRAPAPVAG
jgi:uncharacterized protein YgbK (DUF1537 family)